MQSGLTQPKRVASTLVMASMLIALLGVPVTWAYFGQHARWIADDFCAAWLEQHYGVFGTVQLRYETWSGRFSYWLVLSSLMQLGYWVASVFPALLIASLFITATLFFASVFRLVSSASQWLASATIGAAVVYGILATSPNVPQDLLWLSGSVIYFLPIPIVFAYWSGILWPLALGKPSPVWLTTLLALVSFLLSGFNESFTALHIGIIASIILLSFVPRYNQLKAIRSVLIVTGMVGIVGLLTSYLAPGNAIRRVRFPETAPWSKVIDLTLGTTNDFIGGYGAIMWKLLPVAVVTMVATFLVVQHDPPEWKVSGRVWGISVIASLTVSYLVVVMNVLPSAYIQSQAPPQRAMIVSVFTIVVVNVTIGALTGIIAGQVLQGASPLLIVGLIGAFALTVIVTPTILSSDLLKDRGFYETYSLAWDTRNDEIHSQLAQGETTLQIEAIPFSGNLKDFRKRSDDWRNNCAAIFYGVDTVKVVPKENAP